MAYPGETFYSPMLAIAVIYIIALLYVLMTTHTHRSNVNMPIMAVAVFSQMISGLILAIYVLTLSEL